MERSLAGLAGGPVARVWYAANGATLLAQTQSGGVFQSNDLDTWQKSSLTPPTPLNLDAANLPEPGATVRASATRGTLYGFGKSVWRSVDGGLHWENKTAYRSGSLIAAGGSINDLAVNGTDEITVATPDGMFHSADGGDSWSGLNQGLPNLPVTRIWSLPSGDQGVKIGTADAGDIFQWEPGRKIAWLPSNSVEAVNEAVRMAALADARQRAVTAIAAVGDFIYAGSLSGDLRVSNDNGVSWRNFSLPLAGDVQRIWVSQQDPRIAVAVLGATPANPFRSTAPAHVLRTLNGGAFWDDITGNLPDAAAYGVTVDSSNKAVYVATAKGVFAGYTDLASLGPAPSWNKLPGLPAEIVNDVKLDAQGNQLWVTLDGYGVFSTLAPHRLKDPRVVSAADMIARAVAPGSLVSVLGAKLDSVRVGNLSAPVLASSATSTEIQIPFDARGNSLNITGTNATGVLNFAALTLSPVSPAIFVSADGAPILLDADQGLMLDASNPAHSGTSIQILASGLGRVTPEWPTGLAAPLNNPPRVMGTVHAFLDRVPVEVTRSTLAPGYVGFYLIEVQIPKIVNYGPAELFIDVGGSASNRVRVYVEP